MRDKRIWFARGLRDGIPISLGYFAVAFTMGIAAKNAGVSAWQATLMSATNNTSAGQFAALGLIASGASYLEMAAIQLIINLRYCLMSCALAQKLDPKAPLFYRFFLAYGVTDEIFGVSIGVDGKLNPFYSYGLISAAAPGWALGTYLGVAMGNVLPVNIVSALSVALYGMFIAVIVPPSKKDGILAGLIAVSMAASLVLTYLPLLRVISSGFRIIILTVVIAGTAAVLFPVKKDENLDGNVDENVQEERHDPQRLSVHTGDGGGYLPDSGVAAYLDSKTN